MEAGLKARGVWLEGDRTSERADRLLRTYRSLGRPEEEAEFILPALARATLGRGLGRTSLYQFAAAAYRARVGDRSELDRAITGGPMSLYKWASGTFDRDRIATLPHHAFYDEYVGGREELDDRSRSLAEQYELTPRELHALRTLRELHPVLDEEKALGVASVTTDVRREVTSEAIRRLPALEQEVWWHGAPTPAYGAGEGLLFHTIPRVWRSKQEAIEAWRTVGEEGEVLFRGPGLLARDPGSVVPRLGLRFPAGVPLRITGATRAPAGEPLPVVTLEDGRRNAEPESTGDWAPDRIRRRELYDDDGRHRGRFYFPDGPWALREADYQRVWETTHGLNLKGDDQSGEAAWLGQRRRLPFEPDGTFWTGGPGDQLGSHEAVIRVAASTASRAGLTDVVMMACGRGVGIDEDALLDIAEDYRVTIWRVPGQASLGADVSDPGKNVLKLLRDSNGDYLESFHPYGIRKAYRARENRWEPVPAEQIPDARLWNDGAQSWSLRETLRRQAEWFRAQEEGQQGAQGGPTGPWAVLRPDADEQTSRLFRRAERERERGAARAGWDEQRADRARASYGERLTEQHAADGRIGELLASRGEVAVRVPRFTVLALGPVYGDPRYSELARAYESVLARAARTVPAAHEVALWAQDELLDKMNAAQGGGLTEADLFEPGADTFEAFPAAVARHGETLMRLVQDVPGFVHAEVAQALRDRGFLLGQNNVFWNLVFRVFEELDPTPEQWDAFLVAMMGLMGPEAHRPSLLQLVRFSGYRGFGPVTGVGEGMPSDKGVPGGEAASLYEWAPTLLHGVDLARFASQVGLDVVPPHLRLLGMERPQWDDAVRAAADQGLSVSHVAALTSDDVMSDELDEDDPLTGFRQELAYAAADRLPVFEGPTWRALTVPRRRMNRWAVGSRWPDSGYPDMYGSPQEAMDSLKPGRPDSVVAMVRIPPGPAVRDGRGLGIGLRGLPEAALRFTEIREVPGSGVEVTLEQDSGAAEAWGVPGGWTRSHRLLDEDGRPFVIAYFSDKDWGVRKDTYRALPYWEDGRRWTTSTQGGRKRFYSADFDMPFEEEHRLFVAGHGGRMGNAENRRAQIMKSARLAAAEDVHEIVVMDCDDDPGFQSVADATHVTIHVTGERRHALTPAPEPGTVGLHHLLEDADGRPTSVHTYRSGEPMQVTPDPDEPQQWVERSPEEYPDARYVNSGNPPAPDDLAHRTEAASDRRLRFEAADDSGHGTTGSGRVRRPSPAPVRVADWSEEESDGSGSDSEVSSTESEASTDSEAPAPGARRGRRGNAPATTGDARTPLYPDFYADPEFADLSQGYENAFGELLGRTRTAAIGAGWLVRTLRTYLSKHLGSAEDAATAFGLPAQQGRSAGAVLAELLDAAPSADRVSRLARAFENAAYAHTGSPHTLARLWQDEPGLNTQGIPTRAPAEQPWTAADLADLAGRRGLLLGDGPDAHTERQLQIARALGATERELRLARDAMLVRNLHGRAGDGSQDERAGRKLHSAYEVLRAAHDAGVYDDIDRDPSVVDAAGFHAGLDAVYAPRDHRAYATLTAETKHHLVLPHRAIYQQEAWKDPEDLWEDPAQERRQREAYLRWLALHGAQSMIRDTLSTENMDALLGVRGNRPLLDPLLAQDDPRSRELLRKRLDELVREVHAAPDERSYPQLLLRDSQFGRLVTSGGSLAELRDRAAELAPQMGPRIRSYLSMLTESLAKLPISPWEFRTEDVPGPLRGDRTPAPGSTITDSAPAAGTVSRESAFAALRPTAETHPRLVEVLGTTGRDISPFEDHSGDGTLLHARERTLSVREVRFGVHLRGGRAYEHVVAEEELRPLSDVVWERESSTRTVVDPDTNAVFLYSGHDTHDWWWKDWRTKDALFRKAEHHRLADPQVRAAGPRVPTPWAGDPHGTLVVSTHSDGRYFRWGSQVLDGAGLGVVLRQEMAYAGTTGRWRRLAVISCSAAAERADGRATLAQTLADHARIETGAPNVPALFLDEENPLGLLFTPGGPEPALRSVRPRDRAVIDAELRRALRRTAEWAPLVRELYGTPEFQTAAETYEQALKEALAQRPAVRGTAGRALLAAVTESAGDAGRRSAVAFALGLAGDASPEALWAEASRWAASDSGHGVEDLLRVFATAVTHPERLPRDTSAQDSPAHRAWLRERGIPGGNAEAPLVTTLLAKHRELTEASDADQWRFLEATVAGLPGGLHQKLRAAQDQLGDLAGYSDVRYRAATTADAVGLYLGADELFRPLESATGADLTKRLRLPHEVAYESDPRVAAEAAALTARQRGGLSAAHAVALHRVDALADVGAADPLDLGMAAEALSLLPPVDDTVWIPALLPGRPEDALHEIAVPEYQQAWRDRAAAVAALRQMRAEERTADTPSQQPHGQGRTEAAPGRKPLVPAPERLSNYHKTMAGGENDALKVKKATGVLALEGREPQAGARQYEQTSADFEEATGNAAGGRPVKGGKFANLFGEDAQGKSFAVLMENYRAKETAHPYTASEAFLHQWAAHRKSDGLSDKKAGQELGKAFSPDDVPDRLPDHFYRQNISGDAAKAALKDVLGDRNRLDFDARDTGDAAVRKILATDNGKSTANIVRTFNDLKGGEDGGGGVRITTGSVIRDDNGNLHLRLDTGPKTPDTGTERFPVLLKVPRSTAPQVPGTQRVRYPVETILPVAGREDGDGFTELSLTESEPVVPSPRTLAPATVPHGLAPRTGAMPRDAFDSRTGSWIGMTFFDEHDHKRLAPTLARMPRIKQFTALGRAKDGSLTASRWQMPTLDGSSSYAGGHGLPSERDLDAFAWETLAHGFKLMTLFSCTTPGQAVLSAHRLRKLVDRTGLGVDYIRGRVSLVDGVTLDVGAAFMSLRPGDQAPTVTPVKWLGRSPQPPRYPAPEDWNGPADDEGDTDVPRFPTLVDDARKAAPDYETAMGHALSVGSRLGQEVRATVENLHGKLTGILGTSDADAAFLAPGTDPSTGMTDLLGPDVRLDEAVQALARATEFAAGDQRVRAAGLHLPPRPAPRPHDAATATYLENQLGHRLSGKGRAVHIGWLLAAQRELAVPDAQPLALREALIATELTAPDGHSFAEALAETQRVGAWEPAVEPAVEDVSADRLLPWADGYFNVLGRLGEAPRMTQDEKEDLVTELWEYPHRQAYTALAAQRGLEEVADNATAVRRWLDWHHAPGIPEYNLRPSHLVALNLLEGHGKLDPVDAEMAAEALELLPGWHGPYRHGLRMLRPPRARQQFSLSGLDSGTADREAAVHRATGYAKAKKPGASVLVDVAEAHGARNDPFVADRLTYPRRAGFVARDVRYAVDGSTGTPFWHVLADEVLEPLAADGWDRPIITRDLTAPDGKWLVATSLTSLDSLTNGDRVWREAASGRSVSRYDAETDTEEKDAQRLATGHRRTLRVVHGNDEFLIVPSRHGHIFVTGRDDGHHLRRLLPEYGFALDTQLLLVSCQAARSRGAGVPLRAREEADASLRVTLGSSTMIGPTKDRGKPARLVLFRDDEEPNPELLTFEPRDGTTPLQRFPARRRGQTSPDPVAQAWWHGRRPGVLLPKDAGTAPTDTLHEVWVPGSHEVRLDRQTAPPSEPVTFSGTPDHAVLYHVVGTLVHKTSGAPGDKHRAQYAWDRMLDVVLRQVVRDPATGGVYEYVRLSDPEAVVAPAPEPAEDLKARDITKEGSDWFGSGLGGRWGGTSYYAKSAHDRRAGALSRLHQLTEFTELSREAAGHRSGVQRRLDLPEGTAWLGGHGEAMPRRVVEKFVETAAGKRRPAVALLPCSTPVSLAESAPWAQRMADTHHLEVFRPKGETALVPGAEDASGRLREGERDRLFLGEDVYGRPIGWEKFVPGGSGAVPVDAPLAEGSTPPAFYPAKEYWNSPGVDEATDVPRFPTLVDEVREATADYEQAMGRMMAHSGHMLAEVQRNIEALYDRLREALGSKTEARRAFLLPGVDPRGGMAYLLGDYVEPLVTLAALERAAELAASSPAVRRAGLRLPPRPAEQPYDAAVAQRLHALGHRVTGGGPPVAVGWLLDVHRELNRPGGDLFAFREAVVIAQVRAGRSLAEALDAAQQAGVQEEGVEPTVRNTSADRFLPWSDGYFDARGLFTPGEAPPGVSVAQDAGTVWELPHHRAYVADATRRGGRPATFDPLAHERWLDWHHAQQALDENLRPAHLMAMGQLENVPVAELHPADAEMAAEALELLPGWHGPYRQGLRMPRLPGIGQGFSLPALDSGTADREVAAHETVGHAKAAEPGASVLMEVAEAHGARNDPFAVDRLTYPRPTDFVARDVRSAVDATTGRRFWHVLANEVLQPLAAQGWNRPIVTRHLVDPDGRWIVVFSMGTNDTPAQRGLAWAEAGAAEFVWHGDQVGDATEGPVQAMPAHSRRAMRIGHGNADILEVPSRHGRIFVTGRDDGHHLRRLLPEHGFALDTLVQLASCEGAKRRGDDVPVRAQEEADGSLRVTLGAPVLMRALGGDTGGTTGLVLVRDAEEPDPRLFTYEPGDEGTAWERSRAARRRWLGRPETAEAWWAGRLPGMLRPEDAGTAPRDTLHEVWVPGSHVVTLDARAAHTALRSPADGGAQDHAVLYHVARTSVHRASGKPGEHRARWAEDRMLDVVLRQVRRDPDTGQVYEYVRLSDPEAVAAPSPGPSEGLEARDITREGSDWFGSGFGGAWGGTSFYTRSDQDLRAGVLSRLHRLSAYTELSRDAAGRRWGVQRELAMPEGTAWLGAHGSVPWRVVEEFMERAARKGRTSVALLPCFEPVSLGESAPRVQRMSDTYRLTVFRATGDTAVVPGDEDASGGAHKGEPDRLFLGEDVYGRPIHWERFAPGGSGPVPVDAPLAEGSAPPAYYPAKEYWNSPGAGESQEPGRRSTGAGYVLTPRFPTLYGTAHYEHLSQNFQRALGEVLAQDRDAVTEVANTLSALHSWYADEFEDMAGPKEIKDGGSTAAAARFFADRRLRVPAKDQYLALIDPHSSLGLTERMQALIRAAYGNPKYPDALARLWARKPALRPEGMPDRPAAEMPYPRLPRPRNEDEARQRDLVIQERGTRNRQWSRLSRDYGVQHSPQGHAHTAEWLLRLRAALPVHDGDPWRFFQAVLACELTQHNLAELMVAAVNAKVPGVPTTPIDGERLHAWALGYFDPRRLALTDDLHEEFGPGTDAWDDLRLPHERWYAEKAGRLAPAVLRRVGDIAKLLGVSSNPPHTTGDPLVGPEWQERRAARLDYLREHGGVWPLENLMPGHLLGHLLATGPDHLLLRARLAHPAVPGRPDPAVPELQRIARTLVREAYDSTDISRYPMLLQGNPTFADLVRDFHEDLASKGSLFEQDERDRQNRGRQGKGTQRNREHDLFRLEGRADAVIADLAADLTGYAELAVEAAAMAPKRRGWVGWWTQEPGSLRNPETYSTVGLSRHVQQSPLDKATSSLSAALADMPESGKMPAGHHAVLWQMEDSEFHDVGPAAFHPAKGSVLISRPGRLEIRDITSSMDLRTRRRFAVVTLRSVDQRSAHRWGPETLPTPITVGDRRLGLSFRDARGRAEAAEDYRDFPDLTTYRIWNVEADGTAKSGKVPEPEARELPWDPAAVGLVDVRTLDSGAMVVTTPYGPKTESPFEVGRQARRWMKAAGVSPDLPLVLLGGKPGAERHGADPVAQSFADGSRHRITAATTDSWVQPVGGRAEEQAKAAGVTLKETELVLERQHPLAAEPRLAEFEPQGRPAHLPVSPSPDRDQDRFVHYWGGGDRARLKDWMERAKTYEGRLKEALNGPEALAAARYAVRLATVKAPSRSASVSQLVADFFRAVEPDRRMKDFDRAPLSGESLARCNDRGIRALSATTDLPELLFREFRDLVGDDIERLRAWRLAVFASQLGLYSLHDLLSASLRADVGFGGPFEEAAVFGYGTHLNAWADRYLDPAGRGADHSPAYYATPQELHYLERAAWLTPEVTGGLAVPKGIREALTGRNNAAEARLDALEDWQERHGGHPLDHARSAHLTAMYLATTLDAKLLDEVAENGQLDAAGLMDVLRDLVEGRLEQRDTAFPLLLRRGEVFRETARKLRGAYAGGRARAADVKKYEKRLLSEVDALRGKRAQRLLNEVHEHLGMLADGLHRLPPSGEDAFFFTHEPGELDGERGDAVPGGAELLWMPQFQKVTLDPSVVDMAVPVVGGRHRTLNRVLRSSAPDISFAARRPERAEALYPRATAFEVVRRVVMRDAHGLYELRELRETHTMPEGAAPPVRRATEPVPGDSTGDSRFEHLGDEPLPRRSAGSTGRRQGPRPQPQPRPQRRGTQGEPEAQGPGQGRRRASGQERPGPSRGPRAEGRSEPSRGSRTGRRDPRAARFEQWSEHFGYEYGPGHDGGPGPSGPQAQRFGSGPEGPGEGFGAGQGPSQPDSWASQQMYDRMRWNQQTREWIRSGQWRTERPGAGRGPATGPEFWYASGEERPGRPGPSRGRMPSRPSSPEHSPEPAPRRRRAAGPESRDASGPQRTSQPDTSRPEPPPRFTDRPLYEEPESGTEGPSPSMPRRSSESRGRAQEREQERGRPTQPRPQPQPESRPEPEQPRTAPTPELKPESKEPSQPEVGRSSGPEVKRSRWEESELGGVPESLPRRSAPYGSVSEAKSQPGPKQSSGPEDGESSWDRSARGPVPEAGARRPAPYGSVSEPKSQPQKASESQPKSEPKQASRPGPKQSSQAEPRKASNWRTFGAGTGAGGGCSAAGAVWVGVQGEVAA